MRNKPPQRNEVKQWFFIDTTPEGEAPLHIREDWVGVTLPIRVDLPLPDFIGHHFITKEVVVMEDPVAVEVDDGIVALRAADKHRAALWFQSNLDEGIVTPELLFESSWGKLFSVYDLPES